MIEYNTKWRSEGYTKWNKEKYTGKQQWQEGNWDSNQWFVTKGKISIQSEQNEETRILKNEERLRNFWVNFKHSNIWITAGPEAEKEEQEIENLFEKIMKENFTNLVKEIDSQEVKEESPKEVGPKEAHTKAYHNSITQDER